MYFFIQSLMEHEYVFFSSQKLDFYLFCSPKQLVKNVELQWKMCGKKSFYTATSAITAQ